MLQLSDARELQQSGSGLSLSYTPEYPYYPVEEVDFSHVITIKAPASIKAADRAPISLTAVLDRSGSMAGNKMELVKKSTEFMVEQLQEGDYVGVVSYSNDVTQDVPLTAIERNTKNRVRSSIQEIEPSGSTNLSGGLFAGVDQQTGADIGLNTVKTVLLFTDGLANRGVTDINEITRILAGELDSPDAPNVYTLGFGTDHDAEFLRRISKTGQGSYIFIRDETAVAPTFGEIIGGLLTVTAQRIIVTLEPVNGARIVSVKGGEVTPSRTIWRTEYPDLFAEEQRDILIDMKVPAVSSPVDSQVVLRAKIEYFDTVKGRDTEKSITVELIRRFGDVPVLPATLVEVTRLRFLVAEDITTAVNLDQGGDSAEATATLDGTLAELTSSSASTAPEVESLATDVKSLRTEIAEDDLTPADAISFSSSATAVREQRVTGSASSSSSSSSFLTSAQSASAEAATAFVAGSG